MKNNLKAIIEKFPGKKIVVIGDIMLDKYINGEVLRISPEAPVPVVNIENETFHLGGAGNVASNIKSLGGEVSVFSFIGKDENGKIVKKLLFEKGINAYLDENHLTTFKIRVLGKGQQLLRIDQENTDNKTFSNELKKKILEKAKDADIILISDYSKGAINEDLMKLLKDHQKKIIIDPKPKNKANLDLYKNVLLMTPNEKEAIEISNICDIDKAGERIKKEFNTDVLITLGEKGMKLFSDKIVNLPTYAKEVYDVSGAGDTVIATLSLAYAANATPEEAAILANHAAGIAVEKLGVYSVSLNELKDRISYDINKVLNFEDLKRIIEKEKKSGNKIVWTNGCFDILHVGHVKYLSQAKSFGDILVLGLDSDESVRKLKGPNRPINSEDERAEILSALEFIDYIIIFQGGQVKEYLKILKPDVYVKGGDYTIDTINQEERKVVESYKGKIALIGHVPERSTTRTIEKIKQNEGNKTEPPCKNK
jgi:D-beta-D-heptose 7-phosphate kinase / D-beta-D-heptose 1-phosphate adenosyltransferase